METIELGPTGQTTSRLGFGCSTLMGATGRKGSLRMLETAYDAGVRHFDVAPMYGYGEAESCLSEFLSRHGTDVTVTTKYGIAPPKNRSLFRMGRAIAAPLIRQFPAVKRRLASVAQSVVQPAWKPAFSVEQAQSSLETSLAALRCEQIDVWLLHEATAADLVDDELLRFLEDAVAHGKIRAFGVGSDGSQISELLEKQPKYCSVVQYEWSVFDRTIGSGGSFRIHHRALTHHFTSLLAALKADRELSRRWAEYVGADITDAGVLSQLMLKASLVMNPESIVLFSSKQPERIRMNAAVADDARLEEPAKRFYEIVQREKDVLRQGTQ